MINYVNLNSMLLPLLCSQRNENKIFEMSFSCIQAAWREHPIMHFIEHSPNQKRDWITVSRDAFQTRWTYGSQVTTLMILQCCSDFPHLSQCEFLISCMLCSSGMKPKLFLAEEELQLARYNSWRGVEREEPCLWWEICFCTLCVKVT